MKTYTDKEFAEYLLGIRERDGRTPWLQQLKAEWVRWLYFAGCIVLLLALAVFARSWGFCGFVAGIVVGIFSRDKAWIKQTHAAWAFYVKIIDWNKVETMAKGEKEP